MSHLLRSNTPLGQQAPVGWQDDLWRFVDRHIYWFMVPAALAAGVGTFYLMNRLDAEEERRGTARLRSNRPIA